ncbi:MAG: valine--tRNA ligase [Eubacteriales bacterium]|nr:valine--tRNA ligase [Eubacteriales bacterium]MDD4389533.1 valine--tRNA ligase [Eubacteriales bacterium]
MERTLPKNYNPKDFEDRIYNNWEEKGAFIAVADKNKKPFTIVMPPPNITGQLHMGHALDQTLQDVLIRWKRMQGYSALWLPGSDHASIATEVKVLDKLRKEEGLEKSDIGREEFLKRAWDWKKIYGGKITEQCRKLGDSCDWTRERFTMDEGCSRSVIKFFVDLYEKGLIYKGNKIINWCPECKTALADIEVEHDDLNGKHWYFRYPGVNGEEGLVIATSRPETMFGDVAVAVNPADERYKHLIGKNVMIPLINREIPVIADEHPNPEKGTGAVKITPAHDVNDCEVGERHGLEKLVCLDENAVMNAEAGKYEGMDRYECRKLWIEELDEAGYLVKTEDVVIATGKCYRCNSVIEPMISDQWFVSMKPLAEPAIEAVRTEDLIHVPDRFEKIYMHWLENIKDWCISRQLWWGHRIPAYYCDDCGEMMVATEAPTKCKKCGSINIHQDEDVLDTWFSSGLWPFSTLGWPDKTEDMDYFYPNDVLVTGYDIIFFWVARMVFSGIEALGKVPFKHVYVHGLVRDGEGRKMSKSLGNGVDPLDVIGTYGADALRFMLMTGISPGNDMRFKYDRVEASRNFANKLWNASRFVIMNLEDEDYEAFKRGVDINEYALMPEDKWMLSKVNDAAAYCTEALEKFDLALAGQKVYDVIWNEYCDWYIEIVKNRLYGEDEESKRTAKLVLVTVLTDLIKLLHPFMPFITEEIFSYLPKAEATEENPENFLMKTDWPLYDEKKRFEKESSVLEICMEAIRSIRNMRAEAGAAPSKHLSAVIVAHGDAADRLKAGERYLKSIANINEIVFMDNKDELPEDSMSAVIEGAEIFIPMDELVDYKAELEKNTKEKARLEGEIKRVEGKLSNQGFVSKAPQKVIDEEKTKLETYKDMYEKVAARIAFVEKKL